MVVNQPVNVSSMQGTRQEDVRTVTLKGNNVGVLVRRSGVITGIDVLLAIEVDTQQLEDTSLGQANLQNVLHVVFKIRLERGPGVEIVVSFAVTVLVNRLSMQVN